jgi:hypothetical protein
MKGRFYDFDANDKIDSWGGTMKKLLFVLLIVFTASFAHAVDSHYYFPEPYMLEMEPDAASDSQNIQTSGMASTNIESAPPESIVSIDGHVSEVPIKSISVEAMISDNIQTYNIPISYGFPLSLTGNKELLNLKVVIPYTSREWGSKKDSGLGDISFTANYLIRFPQILMDSKLVLKVPTGELEDADVPLGTGSTDVALYVNGTWYFDRFSLKGGLGYGYNGDTDITGIDTISYGDEYIVSAGGDYNINDTMKAGGVLVYRSRAEDKFEFSGGGTSYTAGINTLEIIPSFTYLWKTYNAEFNASLMIPIGDSWNTDNAMEPVDDPDRSIKFNIGVSKPF